MFFATEEVAVTGQEIDADQHRLLSLEDLIMAPYADMAEVLSVDLHWRAGVTAAWTMLKTVPSEMG